MQLLGHPLRRRHSSGQALVEFALIIPIFMTLVVAIAEFSVLFTSYTSLGFASHDASELVATYGNTAGADCAVIERVDRDIGAPADPRRITAVDIFWVDTSTGNGRPVGGAENIWNYDGGSHQCTKPDGTIITIPFTLSATGYPEANRCNVNQGIGCAPGHTTVDTIGVKITYKYVWITPFPQLVGASGTGPLITQANIMRLEPIR